MIIENIDEKTGEITKEEINALFFDKFIIDLDKQIFTLQHSSEEIKASFPKNLFLDLETKENPELHAKVMLNAYAKIRDYLKLAADEMYDSKKIQYLENLSINK